MYEVHCTSYIITRTLYLIKVRDNLGPRKEEHNTISSSFPHSIFPRSIFPSLLPSPSLPVTLSLSLCLSNSVASISARSYFQALTGNCAGTPLPIRRALRQHPWINRKSTVTFHRLHHRLHHHLHHLRVRLHPCFHRTSLGIQVTLRLHIRHLYFLIRYIVLYAHARAVTEF